MNYLRAIKEYRSAYKNWLTVLFDLKIHKVNIVRIKFRNGIFLSVPKQIVYFLKELVNTNPADRIINSFRFNSENGILDFLYNEHVIHMKFFDNGIMNGEFASFNGDYDFLMPLDSSIVIDIGANIGDSTVWFGIMGASKIIALEPYQYSFKTAVQNIELNNLGNKVVLLRAGYGKDGFVEIENKISNIGTVLEEHKGGEKIPIFSLKTVIDKYATKDAKSLLLKMDCEGCEYNLLSESDQTLKKFSKIIIEYHNGYEDLRNILENCGFNVKYTDPHYWYDPATNRNLIQGYIFATKESVK